MSASRWSVIRATAPELGHGFNQVRLNELRNPLWRFLTKLGLKLDFQNTVGEQFFVFRSELLEWVINPDIHPPPAVSRSSAPIPVILADHGQFGIERDADTSISRELEGSSVVEGTHYYESESQGTFVRRRICVE